MQCYNTAVEYYSQGVRFYSQVVRYYSQEVKYWYQGINYYSQGVGCYNQRFLDFNYNKGNRFYSQCIGEIFYNISPFIAVKWIELNTYTS